MESNEREENHLHQLIKTQATYHQAPKELEARIKQALLKEKVDHQEKLSVSDWVKRLLPFGLVFASGVGFSLFVSNSVMNERYHKEIVQEVLDQHIRSLQVAHLTDVTSTDQHTVKPWFAGKLDFSPPVHDFSSQGYALIGGRLDYIGGRSVAGLAYRHRQHTVNVFIWPDNKSTHEYNVLDNNGFHIIDWGQQGMHYWAVSDLNSEELKSFVELIKQKI